jgi:hypothetical protein
VRITLKLILKGMRYDAALSDKLQRRTLVSVAVRLIVRLNARYISIS